MVKVCVCGGRDYMDRDFANHLLDEINNELGITLLMHGAATGADSLADDWAFNNEIPVLLFRPMWAKYGKSAGPIRNGQMIEIGKPDLVIAFPGGRGTEQMIKTAEQYCIPVRKVGEWSEQ